MDLDYMETVLWAFGEIYKQGFVYRSPRVVAYCNRCMTSLSNFETGLDDSYRDRNDMSVVIRFKDMTFSTGQITYSQKEKQAKTDSAVTMKGEGTRVTGKGFRLSIPDEEFVIKDEVEARLSDVNWASNGSTLPW